MFKLSQSGNYSWPVVVELPVSGGKYDKQTFDAEFKRIPQSRLDEIIAANTPNIDVCKEVMIGWDGITDDTGTQIPYSEGARDKLLDVPQVAVAVAFAFLHSTNGPAKRKN